jgi:hypothetical protein
MVPAMMPPFSSYALIERGANLLIKANDGTRAIDHRLGSTTLQHAKDLRFSSVRELLILSKASLIPSRHLNNVKFTSFDVTEGTILNDFRSARLEVSVLGPDHVGIIASYFLRMDLIVRDPAIALEDQEPDDVKRRVEAALRIEVYKREILRFCKSSVYCNKFNSFVI